MTPRSKKPEKQSFKKNQQGEDQQKSELKRMKSRSTLEVFNRYRVNDYDMPSSNYKPSRPHGMSRVTFEDNQGKSFAKAGSKSVMRHPKLGGSQISFTNLNKSIDSEKGMNET